MDTKGWEELVDGLVYAFLALPGFVVPQRAWGAIQRQLPGWRSVLLAFSPWILLAITSTLEADWLWFAIWQHVRTAFDALQTLLQEWAPRVSTSSRYINLPKGICVIGSWFLGLSSLSILLLGPVHLWLQVPKPIPAGDSHGSAAWGTAAQALRTQRLQPYHTSVGLMLGRVVDNPGRHIDNRYRVRQHVLTCAATGAGKGVGCVIPNLLVYPGAIVCLDVKGENYAVTAQARKRMGQNVFCLDPFGITDGPTHSINWLDAINLNSESCIADAAALAETLVVRGSGADSYWDDAAASLLQGLLLHVASLQSTERHIGRLRALLTLPAQAMQKSFDAIAEQTSLAYGIAARSVGSFLAKADRERSAVLSTALRHTAFLDDPRIVRSLTRTDINFAQLKRQPATVYIVLPPDKLVAYNRFARATLGLAMQAMLTPASSPHDVLFLLDEFAQLGHFAAIENNLAILRGYGVCLWLLVQDLSQLQGVYAKWPTFVANTALQAFGTQDLQTARYLSEMLGQTTLHITAHSTGESQGRHGRNPSTSASQSNSATGRALLTSDEVRRLKDNQVLVFERGQPPFGLRRLDYRTDPESAELAVGPNPMHQGRSY